jgi:hypothetical protein
MQSGQPAQLRVIRTDLPTVEELQQWINDLVRKLISKWTIRKKGDGSILKN